MRIGRSPPFPSMAMGRENARRNPEEDLDLAGTTELLEVGSGEAIWLRVG